MPFYVINGMPVHVKFSGKKKPPAPCVAQIWVSKVSQRRCAGLSAYLCDWTNTDGKTCDAPLCNAHAHQIGKNRHLCPMHYARHLQQNPQPDLFAGPERAR